MEDPKEKKYRQVIFSLLLAVAAWMIGMSYAVDGVDTSLLIYRMVEACCIAIVIFSTIWWWRTDGTSVVFRMIVLLAAGLGWNNHVMAMAREPYVAGDIAAEVAVRNSWIWDTREYGILIAMLYLLSVIISRMSQKRGRYVP